MVFKNKYFIYNKKKMIEKVQLHWRYRFFLEFGQFKKSNVVGSRTEVLK